MKRVKRLKKKNITNKTKQKLLKKLNDIDTNVNDCNGRRNNAATNWRQKKFVEEMLIHGNAPKAATNAGYAWPYRSAATLMETPKVLKMIEDGKNVLMKQYKVTKERIVERYANIAFANISAFKNEDGTLKDFGDLSEMELKSLSQIQMFVTQEGVKGVSYKIALKDVLHALDSLSKIEGLVDKDKRWYLEFGLNELLSCLDPELAEQVTDMLRQRLSLRQGVDK